VFSAAGTFDDALADARDACVSVLGVGAPRVAAPSAVLMEWKDLSG